MFHMCFHMFPGGLNMLNSYLNQDQLVNPLPKRLFFWVVHMGEKNNIFCMINPSNHTQPLDAPKIGELMSYRL